MAVMVTIETPGFTPKRLLILDMNFLAPSTLSLNHDKDQIFVLGKNTQLSSRSQTLQWA